MNPILSALLIVGALGLICSLILVVASYFFRVKEEEKTKRIRECLPGANCGACGYSGCDGYAKAVALGECELNLCIPGSVSVAEKLSQVLGVEVKVDEPRVAFVRCNGSCGIALRKAKYDGVMSCKAMAQLYGGEKDCLYGCLGCGDCVAVCTSDAIRLCDGIAHIDPKACIGCGMCEKECPKKCIVLLGRKGKVAVICASKDKGASSRKMCQKSCIGCKKCEVNCPEKAISVIDNLATIDYEKCSGCGNCIEVCPRKCIIPMDFSAAE